MSWLKVKLLFNDINQQYIRAKLTFTLALTLYISTLSHGDACTTLEEHRFCPVFPHD